MTREEAIAIIRSSELAADAENVIEALEESVRIRAERTEMDSIKTGDSRFGGCPDVPGAFKWPTYKRCKKAWDAERLVLLPGDPEIVPLHFLAQIRLADLPSFCKSTGIPAHGWLCFFYDSDAQPWSHEPPDDRGWHVCFFDVQEDQLTRTNPPPASAELQSDSCRLWFTAEWTLPGYPPLDSKNWDPEDDVSPSVCDEEKEDTTEEILDAFKNQTVHRILGHADFIQDNASSSGQLLLQLDSDEANPGWMWGDTGRLYFWITKEDFRRRDFVNVEFELQCY